MIKVLDLPISRWTVSKAEHLLAANIHGRSRSFFDDRSDQLFQYAKQLYVCGGRVLSGRGVEQGGVWGPFLFALGFLAALLSSMSCATCFIKARMDDSKLAPLL